MTANTSSSDRPGRERSDTERLIRARARGLLVEHGEKALTLRAIAAELGLTAPALYRYFPSRAALVSAVCADVCADLAHNLRTLIDRVPASDPKARAAAAFRGFRTWALRHRAEFALVFGTPDEGGAGLRDQFGLVLMEVTGGMLASGRLAAAAPVAPAAAGPVLESLRDLLLSGLAEAGVPVERHLIRPDAIYLLLRCWILLYGAVALEVFEKLAFLATDPEPLFDALLAEIADLLDHDPVAGTDGLG
ncbi:TetR/AcrR family transcriptional regulator [Pseudonocardia asaccharolytica]|uniref:TetR family transcriptional regulator n=1 Tax=Pseudonocardia asaccharolytica DSM 44247 = NBRC 16224 TaxID=1123024 RepID=A0A511D4C9_9PSEU|nr:TetR family transcriptional regulator [Pseudonocardia asaccharolytica]GEL19659.1 TetR family transcriptional regulator [Pseudonocardia asaccharolytica DSM 44247 = NBRC 16224]